MFIIIIAGFATEGFPPKYWKQLQVTKANYIYEVKTCTCSPVSNITYTEFRADQKKLYTARHQSYYNNSWVKFF